jgi:hypothetical protein
VKATVVRSLLAKLPAPLLNPLRRVAIRLEALTVRPQPSEAAAPPVVDTAKPVDPQNPFSFVSEDVQRYLDECFRGYHRNELLQIRLVRQVLARERMKHLLTQGALRRLASDGAQVAASTVDYNIEGVMASADLDRPSMMFDVIKAIGRVNKRIDSLDALSIGPRSEIEIFGMMAAGFHPDRIKAVDLFSYSPYVELGDMHRLPYPDNSFDVVFLGWVLSYSRDQATVARELVRIGRDRAIFVLAGDYSDDNRDRTTFNNETTHMQSCEQLLALFGDRVGKVYFRHDPEPPDVAMVMTVFEIKKPQGG